MAKFWKLLQLIREYQPTIEQITEFFNAVKEIFNPQTVGNEVRFETASLAEIDAACEGKSEFFCKALRVMAE